MQRRYNIFIASSSEALDVSRAIKQNFDEEADVEIWNENIFKVGRGYLDTLLNRASFYDFVIAVFTPDDEAIIRKKQVKVTRDNVIFEFGLFLGRIGPHRSFLIQHEDVEMFSDWSGIEVAKFRTKSNLVAAVGNACNKIREEMQVAEKMETFSLLPSTSLAIGYYNNFLKRVFEAFSQTDSIKICERVGDTKKMKETKRKISNHYPTIEVQVPQNLEDLAPDSLRKRTSTLKQIVVSANVRQFPFYIEGDFTADGQFNLFDIPTTLYASYLSLKKIFSDKFLATDNNLEFIQRKEIANFERTLNLIMLKSEKEHFRFTVI